MAFKPKSPRFINANRAAKPQAPHFDAVVKDLADSGDGLVVHPDGRVVFVPGVWPGERVRVRITQSKSQFAQGALVQLLEANPARVTPPCPHQGTEQHQCGGCPWMHVDYAAQLEAKFARVDRALRRLQADVITSPIQPSPAHLGYRLRAQLKTDGRSLGFVANGQRRLVDVQDCLVLIPQLRETLTHLRARLPEPAWKPHSKQHWTTLDIDQTLDANQVRINRRLPFQQGNAAQNLYMRDWLAQRLAALPKNAPVLELFAGSGNLTQVLVGAGFDSISAVEAVPEAVAALTAQHWPGVQASVCDLFDEAAFSRLIQQHQHIEILLLDPPRAGLKVHSGLNSLKKLRDIVYISCDLATLCRDLQHLAQCGFSIVAAQPVDLFPQTPHVEILVHLRRSA